MTVPGNMSLKLAIAVKESFRQRLYYPGRLRKREIGIIKKLLNLGSKSWHLSGKDGVNMALPVSVMPCISIIALFQHAKTAAG